MKCFWQLSGALVSPLLILALGVTTISPCVAEAAEDPSGGKDAQVTIVQPKENRDEGDKKHELYQGKDRDVLEQIRQIIFERGEKQKKKEEASPKEKASDSKSVKKINAQADANDEEEMNGDKPEKGRETLSSDEIDNMSKSDKEEASDIKDRSDASDTEEYEKKRGAGQTVQAMALSSETDDSRVVDAQATSAVDMESQPYSVTDLDDEEDSSISESELKDGPSYKSPASASASGSFERANMEYEDTLPVTLTNSYTDENGKLQPLEGAGLTVYDENGKQVASETTDIDGEAFFDLAVGKYSLKQTSVPKDYEQITDTISFEVGSNGEITGTTSFTNKCTAEGDNEPGKNDFEDEATTADVTFTVKSTLNNNGVIGAEISIENEEKQVVGKEQTDREGKVSFNKLEPGAYEAYQSAAAKGYYKSTERLKITVSEDGKVSGDTEFICTPQGTVVLTVVDDKTGGVIKDVGLLIYDDKDEVVMEGKTNDKGTLSFNVPDLGTYTVEQSSAPSGYKVSQATYSFTVGEGFDVEGTTTIKLTKNQSAAARTSSSNGQNNGGSSGTGGSSGAGNGSGDETTSANGTDTNSEGVPQTGVSDLTIPLVGASIAFLIAAVALFKVNRGVKKREDGFTPSLDGQTK